jgi:enamine deaminase RidA (YjgF/YER057c/UK114 family)
MSARQSLPPLFEGVPYEYASVVDAGSLIFTAGACPIDAEENVVAVDDVVAQALAAYDNLQAVLERYGAEPKHLIRTTVYVVGTREDLVTAWTAIAEQLLPHRPPSTLIGVTALGYANQLVEIDGVAALPRDTQEGAMWSLQSLRTAARVEITTNSTTVDGRTK